MNLPDASSSDDRLTSLVARLRIARIADSTFRGSSVAGAGGRAFGGHLAAHALAAAAKTVAPRRDVCSVHAHFLAAAIAARPVDYAVAAIRDGSSFSARQVTGWQDGRRCLEATVLLGPTEPSTAHQAAPPAVDPPERCIQVADITSDVTGEITAPLNLRLATSGYHDRPQPPRQSFWIGLPGLAGLDALTRACVLAYVSDIGLTRVVDRPHLGEPGVRHGATLDHSIWVHNQAMTGDWILAHQHSPVYASFRGLALASLHDASGVLLASLAQQALIRRRVQADGSRRR